MNKEQIKLVQLELSKETGIDLEIDGVAGTNTARALKHIPQVPTQWKIDRQMVGYIQYLCAKNGINAGPIDGYWGPQTEQGLEELKAKLNGSGWKPWRTDEGIGKSSLGDIVGNLFSGRSDWPTQVQSELIKYYGEPGSNQTKVTSPYPLRIAWNTNKTVTKFSCHEKVATSIERVLERVQDHYQDKVSSLGLDLWAGCLNVRKMRGGDTWSTHSWGIAIDWDSARNKLKWGRDKANFAKPEYDVWWKLWEEEGWVSLGRSRNYDWMHVQAAKIRK